MKDDTCPIWGTCAKVHRSFEYGTLRIESPRAGGPYMVGLPVSDDYFESPNRLDEQTKARLTAWLIEQRRFGIECPEITYKTIQDIKLRRSSGVDERAYKLLEYLEQESSFVGDEVNFDSDGEDETFTEMLAWSESTKLEEIEYLLQFLEQRGFAKTDHLGDATGSTKVLVDGHVHLTKLRDKGPVSTQAFVAMRFASATNDIYNSGIAAAISDAGYKPMRIDRKEHNNKIDDEIIAEIRRSRFLVADFTQDESGARGGVYYEAGFAHGLNIPVIFTCRDTAIEEVHFDTRQYRHILWGTPEDLRKKLAKCISATIGDGPLRGTR